MNGFLRSWRPVGLALVLIAAALVWWPRSAPPATRPVVVALPSGDVRLDDVGVQVTLPEGWVREQDAAAPYLPADTPHAALAPRAGSGLPLVLVARLPAAVVGETSADDFAVQFLSALAEQLGAVVPAPEVRVSAVAAPPPLFGTARELVATGAFPELGAPHGQARFLVGPGPGGHVYLVAAFAAPSGTPTEVDRVVGSLRAVR